MGAVGIPEDDQEAVFRVVAAILSLGNIELIPSSDGESCVVQPGQAELFLDNTGGLIQPNITDSCLSFFLSCSCFAIL
jgi:myosin heavy subunit